MEKNIPSSKVKINMIGGGFQHDVCSSALNTNKYVEWVKNGSADISIYIDNAINYPINPSKTCYGWLAESSSIIPHIIEDVVHDLNEYRDKFIYMFTHDKRIIELSPNFFKFVPPNSLPWIQQKQIYPKSKLCSSIVSNKTQTNGHRFRLDVVNTLPLNKVDRFGRGSSNELPWVYNSNGKEESGKLLALKDYYFSFAFENGNYPSIFCVWNMQQPTEINYSRDHQINHK